MRRLCLISIDLFFVALATLIAVMLRGYFDTVSGSLIVLMPYSFISLGCASVIFLVGGLDRTPWRYSSVADHLQVIVLTMLAILLALVLTFALNRLQPVARSLPVLQGGLIVSILIGARCIARFWHNRHVNDKEYVSGRVDGQSHETVLIAGVNSVTELYLLSAKEFSSKGIQVAGIVAEEPSMRGRAIQQKPILGTVEELRDILQSLEVHGVAVNKVIVTTPADRLRPRSLETLLELENSSDILVQFLSEQLGFADVSQRPSDPSWEERSSSGRERSVAAGKSIMHQDYVNSAGIFWLEKRIVDVLGSVLLLFALTPLVVIVALVVALDVGFPLIFWQQRPGLYGRPFKLYKFRTMCAPHDKSKGRIPDDRRSSAVGRIIRRIRLDELPQLYNVLIGDMSLIGPRPLLPCDQSPDYAARLSVRPGVTGWAQVNGGRIITTSDKLLLDIWYVKNASWVLEAAIVLRTVKMVLMGDRINIRAIDQARSLGLEIPLRTTIVPAE